MVIVGALRSEQRGRAESGPPTHDLSRVEIEADEVQHLARLPAEQVKERLVQHEIAQPRRHPVSHAAWIARHDVRRTVRKSHHGIRPRPMQHGVGRRMRPAHVAQTARSTPPRFRLAGRPVAGDVGVLDVDRRLVDRQPESHAAARGRSHAFDVADKQPDAVRARPAATVREPRRIREVMQRDDRFDASAQQRIDDRDVVIQRGLVPLALSRLDAAPLDREAVGVVAQRLGEVEVALVEFVMTARLARLVRQAAALLEFPPVVPAVAAFHLVAGGRGAPEKAARKPEGLDLSHHRFRHIRHSWSTADLPLKASNAYSHAIISSPILEAYACRCCIEWRLNARGATDDVRPSGCHSARWFAGW